MAVLPVSVQGNVAVVSPVFFDVGTCAQVAGWFWVRPGCRQYADWVFTGIDTHAVSPDDPYIYINLGPLVTNGVNEGDEWDTQVGLEVWIVRKLEDAAGLAEPTGR